MTNTVKDAIDDPAAKANELAEKTSHVGKDAAGKAVDVTKEAADKVRHAREKLGA